MNMSRSVPARQIPKAAMIGLCLVIADAALPTKARSAEIHQWPPVSDALEMCLIAEEKSYSSGHACIGRHTRHRLEIAQREPIVHAEKCYEPETAAWARLVNRHAAERPRGDIGKRLAEVQQAWIACGDLKCGYVELRHGGAPAGSWQRAVCMLDETGRRAVELRALRLQR